jgi:hypothetical protein
VKTLNTGCDACKALPGERCRDIGYADAPRSSTGFHVVRVRRARLITSVEARERGAKTAIYKKGTP